MGRTLQQQVVQAVRSGMELDVIEASILDPAGADEDEKAALWLYAQARIGRRPSVDELVLVGD